MYVDAITTAAVADELRKQVLGGRVQDVLEVDRHSVGLEIYAQGARRYLLISADPQSARCHLVSEKLRRGVEVSSPLGLLLRKYVEGGFVEAIEQPAWERVLHLDFTSPEGQTRLIAETMDKRSNIILTMEGDILDSIKRVGADQNRYRVVQPGKLYVPPPPQEKALPESITRETLGTLLRSTPDEPAWKVLVANIAGISPLAAKEVIYRASEDSEAPAFDVAGEVVYDVFRQFVAEMLDGKWSPCVVPAPEAEGFLAFAAYELTHLESPGQRASISEAMADYFGAPVGIEAYTAGKAPVKEQVEEALERLRRKLAALEREQAGAADIENLRKKGELLLAYATTIKPRQTEFRAQYDLDKPPLLIALDPALSGLENAKAYFERYEKSKRALQDLPALEEAARREIAYVEQLATDLDLAEGWPEIQEVREALQEGGYWRGTRTRGPKGGKPGIRRFTADGFVILVARNAAQNHELITERAAPGDLWLHARGVPGSHVIVKNDGRPVPDNVIQRAAQLAAYYSAGRANTMVEVDITERRHVRPIKGAGPGMVTYRQERTISVRPEKG